MSKKILTIDKCQDCKYEKCKYRQLVGLIPTECPLAEYDDPNGESYDYLRIMEECNKHILGIE